MKTLTIKDISASINVLSWLPEHVKLKIHNPEYRASTNSGTGNLIWYIEFSIDEQEIEFMNEVFSKALVCPSWYETLEVEPFENPKQIFISRKTVQPDIDIARRYADLLMALGFEIWIEDNQMCGSEMPPQMDKGIKESISTIIICTSNYDNSPGIKNELDLSIDKKSRDDNFQIIVLRVAYNDNIPPIIEEISKTYQKEINVYDYCSGLDFILRSLPFKIVRKLELRNG